jgi:hypothetical protein
MGLGLTTLGSSVRSQWVLEWSQEKQKNIRFFSLKNFNSSILISSIWSREKEISLHYVYIHGSLGPILVSGPDSFQGLSVKTGVKEECFFCFALVLIFTVICSARFYTLQRNLAAREGPKNLKYG